MLNNFDDIRPYNDEQTMRAIRRAASHPFMDDVSRFLYPDIDTSLLRKTLGSIKGVDDFQTKVMYYAVKSIIEKTTSGLTFGGLEYVREHPNRRFLFLANHRDIVLDSAFLQFILKDNSLPLSEIAVGDNLIANSFVEDLMRSNRMVKVVRSGSPRELYAASTIFSQYLRRRILGLGLDVEDALSEDGGASIWLAHRQGRTKDGYDLTEQGLLKMLQLSGKGDFVEDFAELNILPLSISYEYEPCDARKAYELIKKYEQGYYVKAPMEDIESILAGIMQYKGKVHIEFCKPLTVLELEFAAKEQKNDRFRALADIIDSRIVNAYKLWDSNRDASEILLDRVVDDEFSGYIDKLVSSCPESVSPKKFRNQLLNIYAAPYDRKKFLK